MDLSKWIPHRQTMRAQALEAWIESLKGGRVLDKILGRDLAGIVIGYLEEQDVYNILKEIAGKGFLFMQDAVKLIDENDLRPVRAVHFHCCCLNDPVSAEVPGEFIFVSCRRKGVLGWFHQNANWTPLDPVALARHIPKHIKFAIYQEYQRGFCRREREKASGCCCGGTNLPLFLNHVRSSFLRAWLGYCQPTPPETKWYELYLPSSSFSKPPPSPEHDSCSCS